MSRRQKGPLHPLSEAERTSLSRLSRSQSAPATQVARARALLAVAKGQSYTAAAQLVGREVGDTVARWVAGFNRDGLAALVPHHGGGHRIRYGETEQRRIMAEVTGVPERARQAAGYSWQQGRSGCETGVVMRKRKQAGLVTVTDPDAAAKRG